MAVNVIKAQERELCGKGTARKYRAQDLVPSEFYASQENNMHLLVDRKEMEKLLSHSHGLLSLDIQGMKKKFECIVKDVQYHPVKGDILHMDFQGIKRGEKLSIKVPIVLTGVAAGVKSGGILEHLIRELLIECLPKDIPEKLEIDVSGLNLGDFVRVKDLSFENITILDDPEETIISVEMPRLVEETAEEEEEEEITEPEVITAKSEEEEE